MKTVNIILGIIFLSLNLFVLTLNLNSVQLYIQNHNLTTNIDNDIIHPLFKLMNNILGVIHNCVLGYFVVFQNLFHYCVFIIFDSVKEYFYTFNNLFIYSLDTLAFLVHDYFDLCRFIVHYLFIWPNFIGTFLTINILIYKKCK